MNDLDPEIKNHIRQRVRLKEPLAMVLRYIHTLPLEVPGPAGMMFACQHIFGGTMGDYAYIGGWWIDGSGEIDDATLERYFQQTLDEVGFICD